MDIRKINKFTSCGGCLAKLPQDVLKEVVSKIPKFHDENLLIGFDTSDDGAVYKLSDDLAIIKTLDFFPPMVDDPYLFGKITATNALSDIYAMGGDVKLALNIVCFPETEDPVILGEILRGGGEKVLEAGGVLCGGHSINDKEVKYGMSVTGVVHPDKILSNNKCEVGDVIILTKPLGVGMILSSYRVGEAKEESYLEAVNNMQTLNKYAIEIAKKYSVHSCTDVTGFGFLGHLNEMVSDNSIKVNSQNVPYIDEAYSLAQGFLITGGGQKNRLYLQSKVKLMDIDYAMEEILFDPQTSGGLLLSVPKNESQALLKELNTLQIKSAIVAEVIEKQDSNLIVY